MQMQQFLFYGGFTYQLNKIVIEGKIEKKLNHSKIECERLRRMKTAKK